MRRYLFAACPLLLAAGAHAAAAEAPVAGHEYFSLQIASGDARALALTYRRYASLPYLRIEKRGKLHVLRAGFWASGKEAKAALAGVALEQPMIRTAVYRPEAIVRDNWQGQADQAPAAASPPAARSAVIADAPAPLPQPAAREPAPSPDFAAPPGPKAAAPAMDAHEELRPFNQKDYTLAYDVFAGAGDLQRAYRVAEKAVQSVPDDPAWRLKLARVAEWTQRPQVAWAQREALFNRGDRGDETIAALLRLSPLAPSPDTVIALWKYKAGREPLTKVQWDELARLFDNASRPLEGADFFEAQYARRGDPEMLSRAGRLAENAGADDRAYRIYVKRIALKPFPVDLALHAVVFLLRRDRTREAYELMQAHRDEVPPEAVDYWRMLAQTAWELSEFKGAEEAYRRYLGNAKTAGAADWSRLIALVRQRHPGEAAELALEVYRRYSNPDYLVLALNLRSEANDMEGEGRIFAGLSAQERARAEEDTRFLVLRAQYLQHQGVPDKAWADYRLALRLGAGGADVTVPMLWFLIDNQRTRELEPLLRRLKPAAQEDEAYWGAYAAAYHALDRYQEAVYWYRKQLKRNPDDALLLLNYADALDRLQQTGMADRIRRQVWLRLRERLTARPAVPLDPDPELLAVTRLALQNRPGDPALALVREVAAQLRGLPTSHPEDRETRALVLSWLVSTEQFRNARAWMWLRYAASAAARDAAAQRDFNPLKADARGAPPLWAEIQTALQLNDTQTMDRLLTTRGDGLPIYNRYDTAYALEHWEQALDIAFHGLEHNDVDEELHDRFRQHSPLYSNYLQYGTSRDTYGDLNSRGLQLEGRFNLYRKLQLRIVFSRAIQGTDDPDFKTLTPPTDRLGTLEARWLHSEDTWTTLAMFRRNEATSQTGARLSHTGHIDGRLSYDAAIAYREGTTNSIPLRVAGYADSLRFGVNYNLGKREFFRLAPEYDRFYTQYGDYLGSARQIEAEAGYRIRTEYPNLRARLFVTRQAVDRNGAVSPATFARLPQSVQAAIGDGGLTATQYFLPDGSTSVGACLGGGENLEGVNLQDTYTRAWRPFFEACDQHNSVNGAGYIGYIGIAGSVIGPDHLSLRLDISRGGTGAGNFARTLALRYRYYF